MYSLSPDYLQAHATLQLLQPRGRLSVACRAPFVDGPDHVANKELAMRQRGRRRDLRNNGRSVWRSALVHQRDSDASIALLLHELSLIHI